MVNNRLVAQGEQTEHEVLGYLCRYIDETGVAPSMREIAKGLGMSAPGVRSVLLRLQDKGLVKMLPGVARGIVVTRKGRRA